MRPTGRRPSSDRSTLRPLTRLGIAAAATALASTTALAGAGVAGAQFGTETGSVAAGDFTTKSSSTLVSNRTASGVDVTYTNNSDRTVACLGLSAPDRVIEAFDAHVKQYGVDSMSQAASAQLQARLAAVGGEDMEDKVFLLSYDGTVTGGEFEIGEGSFDILLDDGESMTWNVPAPAGYSAGAALVCGEPDEDYENDEMPFSYVEYVSTTMGGGVLGSLDVFGSLGS